MTSAPTSSPADEPPPRDPTAGDRPWARRRTVVGNVRATVRSADPRGALAAVDEAHGADAVARLYTALGEVIHEQPVVGGSKFADVAEVQADRPDDVRALLRQVGLPETLAEAAGDDRHDATIRASTELAQQRAGDDVGTPIITFGPPAGPSFFGPIMSDFPPGEEAVRLFDAVRVLADHRPFTELKRSLRAMPDTEAIAQVG